MAAAPPVTISIPRLGVASSLESLGIDSGGAMEVPQDPGKAGWYHLGPSPGALGPAVIAGHVTWDRAPAVFYSLAELHPGDVVDVTRRDGLVAVFRVTHVRSYAKSEFPTRSVFGPIDHAGLRLITCAGDFDSTSQRYSDNVVVYARLVEPA
jgi:sortase (surface protein transpeptidase)